MINVNIVNTRNKDETNIHIKKIKSPYKQTSSIKAKLYPIYQIKDIYQSNIPWCVVDLLDIILPMPNNKITHILFINDLWVPKELRRQGMATNLVNTLDETVKHNIDKNDRYITLVNAGAHQKEYLSPTDNIKTQPNMSDLKEYIKEVEKFYIKNGFINVNNCIGKYETKQAMLKSNDISKSLIEILLKIPIK